MKGQTNAKSTIEKYEILQLTITGVENPTVTVEGNSYTGNNLEIKVKAGTTYTISFSEIEDYIAPNNLSYTAVAYNVRTVSVEYVEDSGIDLSMYTIYGTPIQRTTANCYVIKEAGEYKFPCVYGNAISNGQTNSVSYTNNGGTHSHDFVNYKGVQIVDPWISTDTGETITSAQLSIADTDNIFTDITISGDYVKFIVASIPTTGANGIISIKNSEGTIMWNWHIWVWPYDLTPVSITNSTNVSYNILPVNLATKLDTADSINTTTGWKNWFYQFGRPTPMLCPSSYKSTMDHASYGSLSYTAASIASDIQTGIKNPATFYKYSSSYNFNWFQTNSGKTYNLWDAACTSTGNSDNNVVKTIYDPCPIGFKMPNGNTFTYFSTSNVVGSFANGWKFKRYSGDTVGVFFPASGYRKYSDGSLYFVGSSGYVCLSSAYSQGNAYYLLFYSSSVNPQNNFARATGFSVRPVQDHLDLSHIFPMHLKSTEGSGDSRTVPANDQTKALYEYITYNISALDNSGALDLYLDEYDLYIDEFKIIQITRHRNPFNKFNIYTMYPKDNQYFESYMYYDGTINMVNTYS